MPNWKQLLINRIGNPDAHTLTSIVAKLGDAAQTFLTMVGYQGATSLADKLTAARAGYLDNINNAQLLNVPNLSTLTAARIGYLDNINQAGLLQVTAARAGYLDNINNAQLLNVPNLSTLTAARIGYLDNINNANLANIIRDIAESTGTFVYNEASAAEQTVFTLTIAARAKIGGIWLDLVNVTRSTTIRVKHQIDGANYRTFETDAWTTADEDGVLITGFTAYRNVQVSFQCDGAGVGNVNVPYAVV